jgi:hypothetical protein
MTTYAQRRTVLQQRFSAVSDHPAFFMSHI